jgi:putative transposase
MMSERGVMADRSTIHRRAIKMLPVLAAVCGRRGRPIGKSWRMDEAYVRVAGQWKYLHRAVDKEGVTIAFPLRAIAPSRRARKNHDRQRRLRHRRHCAHPGRQRLGLRNAPVEVPQQHHRTGSPGHQRITRPMFGFKNYRCARILIAGIETMHMIRKSQLCDIKDAQTSSPAHQCHSPAF